MRGREDDGNGKWEWERRRGRGKWEQGSKDQTSQFRLRPEDTYLGRRVKLKKGKGVYT